MHSPRVFQEFCSILRFLFGIFFSSAPSEMFAWGKTIGCPGHKNSQMLATIYWCVHNSSSRIPQTSASLKVQSVANWQCSVPLMTHGLFIVSCVLAAWNQHFEMGMGRSTGKFRIFFLQFFTMCAVCFIVFLKSRVSCQALAEALKQNSSLTNLDLGSNNIGPEGAKARLVKMLSWGERVWRKAKEGSRHSCLKVRSGKWRKATQCSICAVFVLRCAKYIIEVCDDNWLRTPKIIKIEYVFAKEEIDSKKPL